MNAWRRWTVPAIALLIGADAAYAQAPPAPAPPPAEDRAKKDAERRMRSEIFESALQDHLAAEKGGPDAEARLRSAVAGYRKVLELRPAAAAWYNLGRAEEALGELASAERSYRNATAQKGADRAFYLDALASFLDRHERRPEAVKVYEELVLLDPRHDRAFLQVRRHLLESGAGADQLLDFLWKIVAAKQRDRAADLALAALELKSAPYREEELLTVVAAAMVERIQDPAALRRSEIDRRLEALQARAVIGRGAVELRRLYLEPGRYEQPFEWWNRPDLEWANYRGVSRRDAFRALMRALGDGYRSRGGTEIAAACYDAAVQLGDDPDPVALRRLATVYIETDRLDRLNALATRYADPKGPLFAAKNQHYAQGQLEKVLLYHRTLGQIYGSLATAGVGDWGSRSNAASAMFQLERAYDVARQLDQQAGRPEDGSATRVDPDLALLYAQGLEATGAAEKATKVRLDTAATFVAAGDGRSAGKVLDRIDERKLSAPDAKRYQEYRQMRPDPAVQRPHTVDPAAAENANANVAETARENRNSIVVPDAAAGANVYFQGPVANVMNARATQMAVAGPGRFEVPATQLWFDTGIDLSRGRSLRILASGRWSTSGSPNAGPEGDRRRRHRGAIVSGAPLASLVAKVGESMFFVGPEFKGESPADGRLYLAINDTPDTYGDNQGSLSVTVELP